MTRAKRVVCLVVRSHIDGREISMASGMLSLESGRRVNLTTWAFSRLAQELSSVETRIKAARSQGTVAVEYAHTVSFQVPLTTLIGSRYRAECPGSPGVQNRNCRNGPDEGPLMAYKLMRQHIMPANMRRVHMARIWTMAWAAEFSWPDRHGAQSESQIRRLPKCIGIQVCYQARTVTSWSLEADNSIRSWCLPERQYGVRMKAWIEADPPIMRQDAAAPATSQFCCCSITMEHEQEVI